MMNRLPHRIFSRFFPAGLLLLLSAAAAGCSVFHFGKESAASREDLEALSQTREQIETLETTYASEGLVPREQVASVLSAVSEYAEDLKEEEILEDYSVSSSNIWMRYASGIQMIYTPDTGDTDAVGTDDSCRIITCQPYADSYPTSLDEEMTFPDAAASLLTRLSDQWTFQDNYDMEEVSLDLLKDLSGSQILLWHGHGGWTGETHSFLATGETFSEDRYLEDSSYYEDFQSGRTVLCSDGRVAVTGDFIEEYAGPLDGSLIYLGACQSGFDDSLAEAFLNKGAAAVVANSDTILTAYNTRMMYSTIEGLTLTDAASGEPYSLEQAMAYAASLWGSTDKEQFGGAGAKPVYFGENIRLGAPVSSPQPSSADVSGLLQAYADRFSYLSGSGPYRGYFRYNNGAAQYDYQSSLPVQPLAYYRTDFDQDGQEELLIVNTNEDYTLQAELYEVSGGSVQLASSTALPATAASIAEDGYLDCLVYQQSGQTTVGFEERAHASHLADGTLIRFTALRYDGSSLQILGSQEYSGSSGEPEEGLAFEEGMASLGIQTDFEQIFYEGRSIFSFLDSPVRFAGSRTYCLWEDSDWLNFSADWYGNPSGEDVEASLIEFQ